MNLIATPSNPIIVPEGHIIIDGQDENRHLRIFPITKEMGNVLITVIAVSNDLTDSTTFKLLFNTPPVAIGAAWSLNEDTTLPFPLNSTDSQNDPLSYTIVKYPTNGTLVLNGDIVTYNPFLDFNGTDILSFKVNDGYSDSNIANVVLTIIEIPDPPVAKDLMFETSENTECPIEFAYTDVDGDILTPVIKSPPQHGHLSPDLIYAPNEWFWGTDTLIYSLSDGNFTSNTATVSILVNRAEEYTLSVKCPKGVGEIEINGRRILLPWADVFVPDTEISIKAISSPDWIFNQWDHGQTIFTDNPLVITMDNGKIITAQFLPPTRLLKILGYQSVEINDEWYDLPLEKKLFIREMFLTFKPCPKIFLKAGQGIFKVIKIP
ncbi:MAG: hypothetical protein OMM_05490 [Candidatus Magnetoglobus multicellularis str. Araruama]|uniref:Bacterial repeat domain-containing protein n=1 Tax=Candidatus Magnetoglobus multicellularis str. Araruama TaxID=890399 RepID=A0A1V1NW36_9BACT|nr:MAG: hypothetical protein OMM_05490 [Candidatus Magnetoglobus multicellularis str. Araruama]